MVIEFNTMKIIIKRCARAHNLLMKKWSWCAHYAIAQHRSTLIVSSEFFQSIFAYVFLLFSKQCNCIVCCYRSVHQSFDFLSARAQHWTISPKNMIDRIKRSHLCFYAKLALNDSFVRIVNVRLGKFFFIVFFFFFRIALKWSQWTTSQFLYNFNFFANSTNIHTYIYR